MVEFFDSRQIDIASSGLEAQTLTIADTKAVGANVECRKVLVKAESGKTVYIGDSDVDDNYPPLPNDTYLELTVSNTKYLNFYGNDGDKVFLIVLP